MSVVPIISFGRRRAGAGLVDEHVERLGHADEVELVGALDVGHDQPARRVSGDAEVDGASHDDFAGRSVEARVDARVVACGVTECQRDDRERREPNVRPRSGCCFSDASRSIVFVASRRTHTAACGAVKALWIIASAIERSTPLHGDALFLGAGRPRLESRGRRSATSWSGR